MPDYEATLSTPIQLGDALPADHLARFVVEIISQLDLSKIYAGYAERGGEAIAPEVLLGLLFYGYATGEFSSRRIEKASYENLGFRYVAGGLHPDHDTIANFRATFMVELEDLFVQILILAKLAGKLKLGNISLDGSKIHADASKRQAVSYGRLTQLEAELRAEVGKLIEWGESADQGEIQLPESLVIEDELTLRKERLENLAQAKAVLEARAKERYAAEKTEYDEKVREREVKARKHRKRPRGREPKPPEAGPRDKDQYNFTDPESRIMKNSTNDGFDQHYNVQAAVDQNSLLIVATSLSNHPNDKREAEPTLDALSPRLGKPSALGSILPVPPDDATPLEKMAYKLSTEIGQAIYRLRKCTVEPVIGIIKEILGFRQFSLRGLKKVTGEWCLVCLAFNLKRLHILMTA